METTTLDTASTPRLHGRWLTDQAGRLTLTWETDSDDRAGAVPVTEADVAA